LNEFKERKEIDEALSKDIPSKEERSFLLTNLIFKDEKISWRVNLKTILENLETLLSFPDTKSADFKNPTLFLKGNKSPLVSEKFYGEIKEKFPNSKVVDFNTGHWLHAEDPEKFLKVLSEFINN
jgi:esterase